LSFCVKLVPILPHYGCFDNAGLITLADDSTTLYFTAADVDGVIGGVVTLPHSADQPLLKNAILAPASADTRLSSTLTLYPEGSLFPFPLDA